MTRIFSLYDYKHEAEKKVLYVDFVRKQILDIHAARPYYKRPGWE